MLVEEEINLPFKFLFYSKFIHYFTKKRIVCYQFCYSGFRYAPAQGVRIVTTIERCQLIQKS